jgi:hypothetical protein
MSNKTTIGLKVSHERNARIERKVDDAGYQSRQAYIRDLIDDDLGGFDTTVESTTTEHTPDDRRDAEIYEALLDYISLVGWTRFGRFKGDIAQVTGYEKDSLFGELKSLRRNGFCTIRVLNPTDEKPHYEIKVKPPAADPDQWTSRESTERPDLFASGVPDDNETDAQKHHLLFAIENGEEDLIDEFDLQEFGLRRVEDEDDDRLVAPIDETEPVIEDEVDRISHGTPNSHIETHVSRTSREQAIEDLRESEELTNDSEAEA